MNLKAYPNPFANLSYINYNLTEVTNVMLKIYDGLGNEIRTLVNEMQEPGEHQAVFNSEGLPQGSYYYKLQTGDKVQANQLILIK